MGLLIFCLTLLHRIDGIILFLGFKLLRMYETDSEMGQFSDNENNIESKDKVAEKGILFLKTTKILSVFFLNFELWELSGSHFKLLRGLEISCNIV